MIVNEMLLLFCIWVVSAYEIQDQKTSVTKHEISILFVILSQNADYDARRTSVLFDSLKKQFSENTNLHADILKTYEDLPGLIGAWAVWPMLGSLSQKYQKMEWDWLLICEPDTVVNVTALIGYLNSFDKGVDHAVGRGLIDETNTIIHHFFKYEDDEHFLYPDFASGLALSWTLLQSANVLAWEGFTIDAKHEFARLLKDKRGIRLNNTLSFCLLGHESQCITRYIPPDFQCTNKITNNDVYFAVKTFSEFHKTRIVVVKRTWAKTAKFVEYFSDMEDHYVPTVNLGIQNTERGHCGKTFGIMAYYLKNEEMSKTRWLVITDDDTLISVSRLYELLSCYDAKKEIIIGERYGYGFSTDGREGYDYPTGGAGMIFSRKAVEKIASFCSCPSIDSPDDMIIGMCARRLYIPIIHSAAFHQAQPEDYSELYLKRIRPISFHKFMDINPYEVYMKRLHEASDQIASRPLHSEL
ncbi:Fringe-like protein [Onchocerca flexuosa]|uniref:Fringe-like protein n=2 Tax=Onchocerca flexuosa TaxID=387005 RepID=A0A238C023_9BILA|nr:Fringe-like protein [Onchocerca flexuosa]